MAMAYMRGIPLKREKKAKVDRSFKKQLFA
jgi:hypothetical protein